MVSYRATEVSLADLKRGDHIRYRPNQVYHHMLVTEVIDETHVRVIHYTSESDKAQGSGKIVKAVAAAVTSTSYDGAQIIEEVLPIECKVERLEYLNGEEKFTPEQAIERAQSRLKEKEYNLFTNNCECLINWAYTDKSVSGQVEFARGVAIAGLAVGAAAGAAAGLYYFSSGEKKKTDKP